MSTSTNPSDPSTSQSPAAPTTFEEFWPIYVGFHQHPVNRALHFAGTTAGFALLALGLRRRKLGLLLAAPVVGYGAAWIGHFFVEKNRPASFNKPLWSFLGDQRMWWKTLRGQMSDEVEKVRRASAAT
ncbi:MAG: DUF962 domain-containing protein [Polyangia bacterium]